MMGDAFNEINSRAQIEFLKQQLEMVNVIIGNGNALFTFVSFFTRNNKLNENDDWLFLFSVYPKETSVFSQSQKLEENSKIMAEIQTSLVSQKSLINSMKTKTDKFESSISTNIDTLNKLKDEFVEIKNKFSKSASIINNFEAGIQGNLEKIINAVSRSVFNVKDINKSIAKK